MIDPELKKRAFELRKTGASYDAISNKLGIASGMLSYWFSKHEWSRKISETNTKNLLTFSKVRIQEMNAKRTLMLKERYDLVEKEAESDFKKFKDEPLFVAALMLYLGEGSKLAKHPSVRIGNTDPSVLQIFNKFLLKYCGITVENIRFWLLSYPDLDSEECLRWWGRQLGLNEKNFYKTQVIQGKHKTKKLRYGVGNIILPSKALKIKILKWIDLMCQELMRV